MKFSDLPLDERLQRAIAEANYTHPTPIQEKAIPPILTRNDLMGIAQTGTGKTAAFALPILQNLLQDGARNTSKSIRTLILLPTRELAIQVSDCFETYEKYTKLTSACIFGGVSDTPQKRALSRGVDILIATPGRLLDLINQRIVSLKKLEFFVLDEADRMLDMGFIHDIRKIVGLLPAQRQNLFFSATMPPEITKLAASILRSNPVRIEVAPQSTPIERIQQELYRIDKRRKGALLKELLLAHPEMKKVLVFSRTKHGADKIVRVLEKAGITCAAIHGNKSQNRRQEALGNFKTEQIRVLVATDIAARGIDVDNVSHVFNYDLPDVPETFVHRIGRTARAGRDGVAISFCAPDEEQDLRAIERLTRIQIPEGDPSILEKLPPPQKETPESEARNSRWRTGKFSNRREKRPKSKEGAERNPTPKRSENQQKLPKTSNGKRLGSRARKRLRAEQNRNRTNAQN
ncbi:DEAD/DEAH box helicase [Fibrobacter intestinalis]|uniref:DEAD/DEAH box helicase n=1 Tax=Fibrobacter intestinalis TaxID=28122 RepID=UPI0023F4E7AB|nr:DEAD/DEAH box helicase [Fibrobacter intestinalis]MDD7299292.1 DEAD/DEAH box helicase [Fibrobacter intestinalis]